MICEHAVENIHVKHTFNVICIWSHCGSDQEIIIKNRLLKLTEKQQISNEYKFVIYKRIIKNTHIRIYMSIYTYIYVFTNLKDVCI